MKPAMREWCRKKLETMRDRLVHDVRQVEEESIRVVAGADRACDATGDLVDASLDRSTEEINLAILGNEEHLLDEVNAALDRLDYGRFGCCDYCHREISSRRLHAMPYSRVCITCASMDEVTEGP